MKHVKLFEQFVNEAKMPDKLIGNDEIVFLKTKEDSRGAHYNLYYKGHDIEKGGARFGSEKELKAFADDYILSNQWYNKLKYEDSKPLPESVDTDDLENAKYRLKDQGVYKHLDIEYKQTRSGEKYVQIHYIPISRPQSQNPEWVNVRYDNAKDLNKISKELGMDLKESVINESDVSEEGYALNRLADNQVGGVPATEFQEEHNLDLDALTRAIVHTKEITRYELRDIIQGTAPKSKIKRFLKEYKK
jgi:hypothetical protein